MSTLFQRRGPDWFVEVEQGQLRHGQPAPMPTIRAFCSSGYDGDAVLSTDEAFEFAAALSQAVRLVHECEAAIFKAELN